MAAANTTTTRELCCAWHQDRWEARKTTDETASSHIRRFIIRLAKNGLAAGETISQVSDRLGFEYPQHFSRMFKKQEGITPSEYCRKLHS